MQRGKMKPRVGFAHARLGAFLFSFFQIYILLRRRDIFQRILKHLLFFSKSLSLRSFRHHPKQHHTSCSTNDAQIKSQATTSMVQYCANLTTCLLMEPGKHTNRQMHVSIRRTSRDVCILFISNCRSACFVNAHAPCIPCI